VKDWKDNVYFTLVEPKESGNIGASARAIKNMGFGNLCLVKPSAEISDEARRFAHNAGDILEAAPMYATLQEAISDKSVVIGTARRLGKRRGVILPADMGAAHACACAQHNKVAILFGREDRGLFNREVDECGVLITIPAAKEQPSLNLSHAVLIIAYELLKAGYAARQGPGTRGPRPGGSTTCASLTPEASDATSTARMTLVSHEEMNRLFARIASSLRLLEYLPEDDDQIERKIMQNLRHFLARSGLTEWEARMLHGICGRVEKKLAGDEAPSVRHKIEMYTAK
jgi:TrmH family RNA methyltransferase